MISRTVTLHVFCSAKGGVGKSTLAVATAKLLAASGRTCVLIDADMTGTSLMDGLRLRAPKVALDAHRLASLGSPPTGEYFEVAETRTLRNERKFTEIRVGVARPLPVFLNDVLTHRGPDLSTENAACHLRALYWRHEVNDSVHYLPSSPLPDDVALAGSWQVDAPPFSWMRRMAWLFDQMVSQESSLTDIVVDLAPGLVGYTREMLALLSHISRLTPLPKGFPRLVGNEDIAWKASPFLVTSKDFNDLVVALEFVTESRGELPELSVLLNKCRGGHEEPVRNAIVQRFGLPIGDPLATQAWSARVEEMDALREVFVDGDIRLAAPPIVALAKKLRLDSFK